MSTVVFTNGCFDLLHAGHVALLHFGDSIGDKLIVAVDTDASVAELKGANRPIMDLKHRATMIQAVVPLADIRPFGNEEILRQLIRMYKPDILLKGGDYSGDDIVGKDQVEGWGGRVCFMDRMYDNMSTSDIIRRCKES